MTSYTLKQSRYGETRTGDAVLIFVSEDLLTTNQVKRERGNAPATTVLKMNAVKRFTTGVYDYAMMTSTFTPVDVSGMLKITFGSQDWCGQSFAQINRRDNAWHLQVRSYFQEPGDLDTQLPMSPIEEEVWSTLRMAPQRLPVGRFTMIPSQEFQRLYHVAPEAVPAEATLLLQVSAGGGEDYVYKLHYPTLGRSVEWQCEAQLPHRISRWRETIAQGDARFTSEMLEHRRERLPYWQLNKNEHSTLRDSLGLRFN